MGNTLKRLEAARDEKAIALKRETGYRPYVTKRNFEKGFDTLAPLTAKLVDALRDIDNYIHRTNMTMMGAEESLNEVLAEFEKFVAEGGGE